MAFIELSKEQDAYKDTYSRVEQQIKSSCSGSSGAGNRNKYILRFMPYTGEEGNFFLLKVICLFLIETDAYT